jgi:hypothetical protein
LCGTQPNRRGGEADFAARRTHRPTAQEGRIMTVSTPRPPPGLKAAGKRLWTSVAGPWQLEEHEAALLLEAARTVDLLDELEARVKLDGAVIESPQGMKAHPAAVELRQQRIALARLLAALRLPEDAEQATKRPGRRGPRGVYGLKAAR